MVGEARAVLMGGEVGVRGGLCERMRGGGNEGERRVGWIRVLRVVGV